jgi:Tfp pilus assembly protein PilE
MTSRAQQVEWLIELVLCVIILAVVAVWIAETYS